MSKGEIIKNLIKSSGIPISEIARRIDVDRRTIYSYFKKDSWKPEILQKISIACGKDKNFLVKKVMEQYTNDNEEPLSQLNDGDTYKTSAGYAKEIEQTNKENQKLMRRLVELQEKHIRLHEDFLNLQKSLDPE